MHPAVAALPELHLLGLEGIAAPVGGPGRRPVAGALARLVEEPVQLLALDRAAAFARVTASGCTDLADDSDATEPARAESLTRRAARLAKLADELTVSARLWRDGVLD